MVLAALGICAHRQVSYWRNSVTLFSHAIEVTHENYLAYYSLGGAYSDLGRYQDEIEALSRAVTIKPDYAEAHNNLGNVYSRLGRYHDAIDAHRRAIRIKPNLAEVRYNLANELVSVGSYDEAVDQLRMALQLRPDWPDCMSNLADVIATCPQVKNRDVNEAIHLASRACELAGYRNPLSLNALAAAYASAGRFSEAVDMANKALILADAANQSQLKDTIEHHLSFYRQGKPYIEPPSRPLQDSSKP